MSAAAALRRPLGWLAAAALLAQILLALFGAHNRLDAALGDLYLRADAARRPPPAEIVHLDIDQASLDDPEMLALAGNWPWPRAIHGEMLMTLAGLGARAIVLDLIFSEPDVFRPHSDALLAEGIAATGAFIPLVIAADGQASRLADLPAPMGIRAGPGADPEAALPLIAPKALPPEQWRTGIINFLPDPDGIGRAYWIDRPHAGWWLPSLPARVVRELGIEVAQRESLRLRWYAEDFPRISYTGLYLQTQRSQPQGLPDLTGKIVVIGAAAPGLHDFRPTPLDGQTPGTRILATAIANLLHGDELRPLSALWGLALGLCLVLIQHIGFVRRTHPLKVGAALLGITLSALFASWLLLGEGWQWWPFSPLLLAWLHQGGGMLIGYLQERRRRAQTVQLFQRFLDPAVVRQLVDAGAPGGDPDAGLAGESRQVTLMFTDIRGFTSLSEHHRPDEIVALLNRYFQNQVEAVFAEGGTLDKFIGDAIMAFWGAPLPQPDHALRAVRAALEMSRRLDDFKRQLGPAGETFEIGIGVHTGEAVVGFIGTRERLDYTAIGDTVNLASRIEGQTKGVARVLVSEVTREACGDAFDFIDRGMVTVKGRVQPVRLFEPREKTHDTD